MFSLRKQVPEYPFQYLVGVRYRCFKIPENLSTMIQRVFQMLTCVQSSVYGNEVTGKHWYV